MPEPSPIELIHIKNESLYKLWTSSISFGFSITRDCAQKQNPEDS